MAPALQDNIDHDIQPSGYVDVDRYVGREAIESICLGGLALDNQGSPVELILPRINPIIPSLDDPPRDEHVITCSSEKAAGGGPRPVSGQGRRLTVRLSLKDTPIAISKRSAVYEVAEAVVLSADSSLIPDLRLPPLVVKIAQEATGRNLYHEAGMYRLLDNIQGIILARCYGYFRRSVNLEELVIKPWEPRAKWKIQKLGPLVSTLKTVPIGMQAQLQEMVKTLVELEVTHEELQNGTNVFHAAPDPEDGATTSNDANSPGKPCTHQWRIIDLEDCKPSEWEMEDNLLGMTTDITELVRSDPDICSGHTILTPVFKLTMRQRDPVSSDGSVTAHSSALKPWSDLD
ncbi:hypothetical protein C8Q70DRAFT_1053847 [Cubamyces menziesii]|nr:hypothetical protein C8Q70DRAFT_1053847 [Cubamyces menziesii]